LKSLGITAKWVFILCLPILLLTASIGWAVNSFWLYKSGFDKYYVSLTTGLEESELEKAAGGLIGYLNSDEEYISLTVIKDGKPFELFNEREAVHLKDVKKLIRLDYRVLLGTLVYALAYAGVCLFWQRKEHWRRLAWGVVGGSSLTLIVMLALGIGALLDFDRLFIQFHLLSFTNEFWMLDPATDYLIMLFPADFWYDTAILCAGITAGLAKVLGGVSGGWLVFNRGKGQS